MNDILPPPKRPLNPPAKLPPLPRADSSNSSSRPPASAQQVATPDTLPKVSDAPSPVKKSKKKMILLISLGIIVLIVGVAVAAFMWYRLALSPVDTKNQAKIRVEIVAGTSPDAIGADLEQKKLIQSKLAFDIYTRLTETRSKLQAGTYSLSPSESTETIVGHLVNGKTDKLTITFLPGATVAENKTMLKEAGFSPEEIETAFAKLYNHPLFTDKPEGTDLEGYIYGETYTFSSSASVEEVLTTTFDHYYQIVKENGLINKFKQQGLNLYQGITLASIVQREVSKPSDQKQVAQVFLRRLAIGMPLGSDVTYQYAAKKLGVAPTPELDSPYNTRKVAGLPPGPIASPGRGTLDAVANPASGDYLFFLSGDDNVTYFARTAEEHEANIRDHCHVRCSTF